MGARDLLRRTRGFSEETASVDPEPFRHDGRDCMRIWIPRGNHWKDYIVVDPSRAFIPVRFAGAHNGVPKYDKMIQYVEDAEAGWRVSTWWDAQHDQFGGMERWTQATVGGINLH